jgi:fumarate reductase subunit D
MARSNEPLWWLPFSMGGLLSALLMPITLVLTSLAVAFGWIDAERMYGLMHHPLVRIYLFVLISLSLFHALHRIRFLLVDFGLKQAREAIAVVCYGSAIVGSIIALFLVLRL